MNDRVGAYILVGTQLGQSREVTEKLKAIPGVLSAHPVTGDFDVIVAASFKHFENLTSVILPSIQKVAGVARTVTCVCEDWA
jgi:DNA-binding Lrp family transcriptional regulator